MLDSEQAHPIGLGGSCRLCPVRLADIDLDLRGGHWLGVEDASCSRWNGSLRWRGLSHYALVDDPLAPIHGDLHAVLQNAGGLLGSHHCRTAQLSADDGCMAGHSALIGDDGTGPLHPRNHIRHGHLGDHDVALLDLVQVSAAGDNLHNATGHTWCCTKPVQKDLAAAGCCWAGCLLLAAYGGDGTGLEDVDLVLLHTPLDILREAVMLFQDLAVPGQLDYLLIGEDHCLLLLGRDLGSGGLMGLGISGDHDLFGGDIPVHYLLGLPVHHIVVR